MTTITLVRTDGADDLEAQSMYDALIEAQAILDDGSIGWHTLADHHAYGTLYVDGAQRRVAVIDVDAASAKTAFALARWVSGGDIEIIGVLTAWMGEEIGTTPPIQTRERTPAELLREELTRCPDGIMPGIRQPSYVGGYESVPVDALTAIADALMRSWGCESREIAELAAKRLHAAGARSIGVLMDSRAFPFAAVQRVIDIAEGDITES